MDTLKSRKEGAVYLKVSLPTFGKFVKQHPEIIQNKKVNMKLLIKITEKESAKRRGNIL